MSRSTPLRAPGAPAETADPAIVGKLQRRADDASLLQADLPAPQVQSHASNLMTLGDGSLGCVWFSGSQEGVADISIWFSRLPRGGDTWSAPVQLSNDATRSEQNPILFPAPDGRLWLIHTAQNAGNQDTALVRCRVSDDNGISWGASRELFDRPGIFVRQPLVVLDDGQWLVPIFHCRVAPGEKWAGHEDTSSVMISADQGQTWREVVVPESTGCVHMNVVPGRNRGELLAFYRSRWADHVYRSVSTDHGKTWSAPVPTELPNNNSSIQVTRLASGALAMVLNESSRKDATEQRASLYDEIDDGDGRIEAAPKGRAAFWGAPRAPMTIALSDDEGLTWPHRRNLETGDGYCMTNNSADRRNREYSYPTIHQSPDGTLEIAYTVHRQRIRHVRTTESWVRQSNAA